jgi:heat shock protein HslJ
VTVTDEGGLSSSASTQVEVTARLDTTVWRLDPTLEGTVITLQFLGGELAGFAGCNTYAGSYTATVNDDGTYSVTVTGITNTQVACPQAVMDQEADYLAALGQVTSAQVQGNTLVLSYPGGTLTFFEVR